MNNPAARIKAKALQLGFTKAGIAEAARLTKEAERLQEWLSRGYGAGMNWIARSIDKRTDPRNIVPGAQSVIVVALNYYTPEKHHHEPGVGKISRYAWGDDYHDILTDKLERLWVWMKEEFPGVEGRHYVDTGPVMEKVWAERAGIGWIAKNANVITREVGSWVFLGALITTLELEPDDSATDHCGKCTLCIDACPTGALVDACVVDSNVCLSYLTIEHRGDITGDITRQFEGWIYGCDICQDVCPWNRKFAGETTEERFRPRHWNIAPLVEEWREMTPQEFNAKFRGSPIKRTKVNGLVRNARIAWEALRAGNAANDPNVRIDSSEEGGHDAYRQSS